MSESTKKTTTENIKTTMEELLGDTLFKSVKGNKTSTVAALKDKDLVALYFSAKWCPPCRAFSPILKDFYKACAEKGRLEIIYISSDKSFPEWTEYYGSMPWMSLPEGTGSVAQIKSNLALKLKIQGIPSLIVLEVKTGNFVTSTGREDVAKSSGTSEKGLEVIESWKSMDAVPIEEAYLLPPASSGIMGIVSFILKNPIYIFGLLYLYKWLTKYPQESAGWTGAAIVNAENVPIVHDDTEF